MHGTLPSVLDVTKSTAPHLAMSLLHMNGADQGPAAPEKQSHAAYLTPSPNSTSIRSNGIASKSSRQYETSTPQTLASSPSTPSDALNGESEGWSAAVGRASVAGKSGRVIERLMGDVDKLKRELRLASATVEEEQRRSESARLVLDSLRGTNENLEAITETDKVALARRDRKIEELKADLEVERSRRTGAEKDKSDMHVEILSLKRNCEDEVLREKEISGKARGEYETLKSSLSRMERDFSTGLARARKDFDSLQGNRSEDLARLQRLDFVCQQLRDEHRKEQRAVELLKAKYLEYRSTMDNSIRDLSDKISRGDAANEGLLAELRRSLGSARWIMNVRESVKGIE